MLTVTTIFKECSDVNTSMLVYAGLLTSYLMKWRANPLISYVCSSNQTANISTIPHWYSTVVLDVSSLATIVSVRISFGTKQTPLTQNMTLKTSFVTLSFVSFDMASHILFSDFDVGGRHRSVSHQYFSQHTSHHGTFQDAGTDFLHILQQNTYWH